jgi:lipooligosaccharide transport system permease protein
VLVSALLQSADHFSYVTSIIITPVFLVAGTYFPLDGLPEWAQVAGHFNPLFHCVELVRHAAFGWEGLTDLGHLAALLGFAFVTWRLAIWRTNIRLVD